VTQAPDAGGGAPHGSLRPTSPAVVAAWAVVGLVVGWLVHPLAERLGGTAPVVAWAQPFALLLVAAILGGTAQATWRSVHVRRERLEAHQAVNRLVLARACAYVGALAGGGYLGYALSWLGSDSELADERLLRSAVAALGGLAMVVTALLLERACRVPGDDDER
jgi:xanthosine utilization system XapX-like protein